MPFLKLSLAAAALAGALTPQAHAQKTVFAHYLVTNQDYQGDTDPTQEAKIAAYEKEILQAKAAGIDGFALNVGGWLNQTYYIRYSAEMFEAAARLNSGFKLVFSADMCCGNGVNDVEGMVRRFVNDARYNAVYYKQGGRPVLTTFSGESLGTGFWQQVKSDLANGTNPSTATESTALAEVAGAPSNAGVNIFLVPAFFWGGEIPTQASIQQGFSQYQSIIDGSFYWGIAGVPGGSPDQIPSSEAYASVVHGGGKLYMAPVTPQFWGANANRYYEYSGYQGFRKLWLDAINVSKPDWIELITWNDFIEGSYVSPIDDPNKYTNANFLNTTGVPSSTLGYFHSHYGFYDLLPFFIKWYKTGAQPAITQDAVYYAYRTQPASYDAGTPSVANKYGPVSDQIYITSNLLAPASLKVTSGGQTAVLNLPAGSSDTQTPFLPGNAPSFELDRNGTVLGTGTGTDPIPAAPKYNDYYYSTGDFVGSASGGTGGGTPVPTAPTGLSASAGSSSIALTWTASSGAASYNVFRGTTSGGEAAQALVTGLTGTSYADSSVNAGTTYYYKVSANNASGASPQSNEASAQVATGSGSGGGGTGSGQPDLIVTSVSLKPANPATGDPVVFTAVVKNQGTGATAAGVVIGIGFDLDGSTAATTWEDTDTASLAPGASVTLTATGGQGGKNSWTATAGSHTVTAWVDDVNRIAESNENNNKLAQSFTVAASGGLAGTHVLAPGNATGSALDDAAASTAAGNPIQIYTQNGTAAQQWTLSTTNVNPVGFYTLAVLGSNCATASSANDGSPVQLQPCNGSAAQAWQAVPTTGGYIFQSALNAAKCLDVRYSATQDGTPVQVWGCDNTSAQVWGVK